MSQPLKLRVELTDRTQSGTLPVVQLLDRTISNRVPDDLAKAIREKFTDILFSDAAETEIQVASGKRYRFQVANLHHRSDASGSFELHEIVAAPRQVPSETVQSAPPNGFSTQSSSVPKSATENSVAALLRRVQDRAATTLSPSDYAVLAEEFAELMAGSLDSPAIYELLVVTGLLKLSAEAACGHRNERQVKRLELVAAALEEHWQSLCQSPPTAITPSNGKSQREHRGHSGTTFWQHAAKILIPFHSGR